MTDQRGAIGIVEDHEHEFLSPQETQTAGSRNFQMIRDLPCQIGGDNIFRRRTGERLQVLNRLFEGQSYAPIHRPIIAGEDASQLFFALFPLKAQNLPDLMSV